MIITVAQTREYTTLITQTEVEKNASAPWHQIGGRRTRPNDLRKRTVLLLELLLVLRLHADAGGGGGDETR